MMDPLNWAPFLEYMQVVLHRRRNEGFIIFFFIIISVALTLGGFKQKRFKI